MIRFIKLTLLCFILLVPCKVLHPQEKQFDAEFADMTSWTDPDGTKITIFTGNVRLTGKDFFLRANRVVLFKRPGTDEHPFNELYAEGNVIYKTSRTNLQSNTMFYDRLKDTGEFDEITLRFFSRQLNIPLIIRAREAKMLSSDKFALKSCKVTSCDLTQPHYYIYVRQADVTIEESQEAEKPTDLPKGETYIAGRDILLYFGGLPVFYLPYFAFYLGEEFILRSFKYGRSQRFGHFVLFDWGINIKKGFVDSIFGNTDPSDDRKNWAEVIFETDYRRERGYAFGIDPAWKWSNYSGYIDTYLLDDYHGPNPDITFDRKFIPPEKKGIRYRIRLFHRHELTDKLRAEVESSYITDRNLLEEFFPREFKQGKEQETVLYLRYLDRNLGAYFAERHRLNDFQTQVEFLPKSSLWWLGEPFIEQFRFSTVTEFANLRKLYDEKINIEAFRTARFTSLQELFIPFDLDYIQISPFVINNFQAYENDINLDSRAKDVINCGIRLKSSVHGIHDVQSKTLGIDKIRHIMEFETAYSNNLFSSDPASKFYRLDRSDTLDEFTEISFEFRNRFQTKIKEGDETRPHEFLNFGFELEYYPRPKRDTVSLNENNFTYPFNWVSLFPLPGKQFKSRNFSNLLWDTQVKPTRIFSISAKGEYNPDENLEEVREFSLSTSLSSVVSLSLGHYFLVDTANSYSIGCNLNLEDKWQIGASTQYDFMTDRYTSQRVNLQYDLHDFWLQVYFDRDFYRNDIAVFAAIVPKFLRLKYPVTLLPDRRER